MAATERRRETAAWALIAVVVFAAAVTVHAGGRADIVKFAAEMAENGNWREAHYRWDQVVRSSPGDARMLNNLAVATEALGDVDREGQPRVFEWAKGIGDPVHHTARRGFV